jgi:hypothetical protein
MTALRVPDAPPTTNPPTPTPLPPPRPKKKPLPDTGELDEHGEPRARRRKKSRRSPLFWVVIVLFTFGLLTCLACGGGMVLLAVPRWHTHQSEAGGFKVELPAKANPNIARDANLQLKRGEFVEGAALVGRVEFFWVWYKDVPERGNIDDEAALDETIKALEKETNGRVLKQTPKRVNNYPAREVVIDQPGEQIHHCLIVLTKSRLYVATVSGLMLDSEGNERVRRFLDSFQVVNPNPNPNPWRGNAKK